MSRKSRIKISSNRSFGLVFFFIFLIFGLWPITNGEEIRIWLILMAFIFLILGIIVSKLLSPLNRLWFKFGIMLGGIVAPIVMAAIFFIIVTPIAIFMSIIGKDLLNKKHDKKKETYWIKRIKPTGSMKRQF